MQFQVTRRPGEARVAIRGCPEQTDYRTRQQEDDCQGNSARILEIPSCQDKPSYIETQLAACRRWLRVVRKTDSLSSSGDGEPACRRDSVRPPAPMRGRRPGWPSI